MRIHGWAMLLAPALAACIAGCEPTSLVLPVDARAPDGGAGGGGPDLDAGADAGPGDAGVLGCPVLVIGGSASGVSASLAAVQLGARVCLLEEGSRLGGQLLSVGELDENPPPELSPQLPYSTSYRALRAGIQADALARYTLKDTASCGGPTGFNPGVCSCCTFCYEPNGAERVLEALLNQAIDAGTLVVLRKTRVTAAHRAGNRVVGVSAVDGKGRALEVSSEVLIDATEEGSVIPLAGVPYRVGFEPKSDTGETHAPDAGNPECQQPFTFTLAFENRPAGEDHRIPRPAGYDRSLYAQSGWTPSGELPGRRYVVENFPNACGFPTRTTESTWRRMRASARFVEAPTDLFQVNTRNDFNHGCVGGTPAGCNLLDSPVPREQVLAKGRAYALGYAYYLQTDVLRDDDAGYGYPNLRLAGEVSGTVDGVSEYPYVRESRRIRALTTVIEDDVSARLRPGASRARTWSDSVGVGQYALDLHMSAAGDSFSQAIRDGDPEIARTLPFQIPLGALIPQSIDGFLAAGKNLGTTHITNGTYRTHTVEWHIGVAAGALAARAVSLGVEPRAVRANPAQLRRLQQQLLRQFGDPLFWYSDVNTGSPPALFVATQLVAVEGLMTGVQALEFQPAVATARGAVAVVMMRYRGLSPVSCTTPAFNDVPCSSPWAPVLQSLVNAGALTPGGAFRPDAVATRREAIELIARAMPLQLLTPATAAFTDVPTSDSAWGSIEAARAAGLLRDEVTGAAFAPDAPCVRAALAVWMYNALRQRYGLP